MTTRTAMAQRYQQFFTDRMGVGATIDEHENVRITWGGWRLIVANFAPEDPEFFHVACAITAEHPELELLRVAAELGSQRKLVKVRLIEGGLVLGVEMLLGPDGIMPSIDQLAGVVPRALMVLASATEAACEHLSFLDTTRDLALDEASVLPPPENDHHSGLA